MEFRIPAELPRKELRIAHTDPVILLGSCFAQHIGNLLLENKFRCQVNPFGILYNPLSVKKAISEFLYNKKYTPNDLFLHQNLYHSYMHHGSFSGSDASEVACRINDSVSLAHTELQTASYLFITLGTAWVYRLKETGSVVSNCHRVSEKKFLRTRLSVAEIVEAYRELMEQLSAFHPQLRILFTVSPVRHIRDGLHGNQLSKSTLLLAIDELCRLYPEKIFYFPAYEIVTDELRDYRFYAEDMLHPSSVSIHYVWEKFRESYFDRETLSLLEEIDSVKKALNHRPIHPGSPEHAHFLEQIVLKINRLTEKYPNLDLENEMKLCRIL
ncbi:MAG: GSCFA domain-containing protein [Bacteroides sp.]|nr:GSCFA domain-containing protein [Bacteroides sp.]